MIAQEKHYFYYDMMLTLNIGRQLYLEITSKVQKRIIKLVGSFDLKIFIWIFLHNILSVLNGHFENTYYFIALTLNILYFFLLWMTLPLWLKLYFTIWPGNCNQIVNLVIYNRNAEIMSHVVFRWPISPLKNCRWCSSSRNITEVAKQRNCLFQNLKLS